MPLSRRCSQRLTQLFEVRSSPHVEHEGDPVDPATLQSEELDDPGQHLRRKVVDAEVAHVLESGYGLRLPRTGHAGDDGHVQLGESLGHASAPFACGAGGRPSFVHQQPLFPRGVVAVPSHGSV